jgi:pyrimidine-specific ribonucleoside hydrolase
VDYSYDVINKILKWHHKAPQFLSIKDTRADDLGVENDGTRALYEALKKEKLTILALGPMTNIATLIQNHPDIIPQIEKISICAARTPGLLFNPGNGKLMCSITIMN